MLNISTDKNNLLKALRICSIVYFVVVLLWIILMAASGFSGTLPEQIKALRSDILFHILNFVNASFISQPITAVFILLALLSGDKLKLRQILGIILLVPYILLVSFAYTSQYTYFPMLLLNNSPNAIDWYFNNPESLVYFLDQLGYFFFAISGLLIGFDYVTGRGMKMMLGVNIYLVASFSVAAFALFAINPELGGIASVISGGLTLPMAVIIYIFANNSLK
jgi:CDP-diacylglycerol--glycerol-3-phosphate 3-phosphatidyltransferase